jgi:hypothetical protein
VEQVDQQGQPLELEQGDRQGQLLEQELELEQEEAPLECQMPGEQVGRQGQMREQGEDLMTEERLQESHRNSIHHRRIRSDSPKTLLGYVTDDQGQIAQSQKPIGKQRKRVFPRRKGFEKQFTPSE